MIWLFRVVVCLIGTIFLCYLQRVFVTGRALRYGGSQYGFRLTSHRRVVNRVLFTTFVMIVAIVVFSFFLPPFDRSSILFQVHLKAFALPFLFLFLVIRN